MHFVIRAFYYNNFCAIHQWNPVCRNIKACWENTGSFDNWVKLSVIYGIFIVTLHGNIQVPAEFLLDPLLLSGRYQCKCSDCATYTFCNLLLAVRLNHSKWIILSFTFLNINGTNAFKVRTWPGYTNSTEKQEKKTTFCAHSWQNYQWELTVLHKSRYSHSTLLSRKMDWKPFPSLKAVKHWKRSYMKGLGFIMLDTERTQL